MEIRDSVLNLIAELDSVVAAYGDKPVTGARYETEFASYPDKDRITDPYTMARLNLRVGRDNLLVLGHVFENDNVFAISVLGRSVLESSASVAWFLDPSIDEHERVKRGIIQLCEAKSQVKKITPDPARIDDFFANRLPAMLTTLGIQFLNRHKKPTAPQNKKPSYTEMAENMLGMGERYSILSGVVHGQHTMLLVAGYDVNATLAAGDLKVVARDPNKSMTGYALVAAVQAFREALRRYFEFYNWDFSKIEPSFAPIWDALVAAYPEAIQS